MNAHLNSVNDNVVTTLEYNGAAIRIDDDKLNLTDMWRAAGSPENREPYNWARKEGTAFIDAVAMNLNLPDSQVLTSTRGKNGGTTAHWQIGLAYAKYLSPEFHMWCNTVVRERMEGGPVPTDMHRHLNDPGALRGLLLTYTEKVLALEGQLEEAQPKLDGFDRIAQADGTIVHHQRRQGIADASEGFVCMAGAEWLDLQTARLCHVAWLSVQDRAGVA